MVYVFDIDGTICTQVNRDYAQALPIKSRIKAINKLYKEGHYIVFHTARGMGRSNNSSTFAYAKFFELTQNQKVIIDEINKDLKSDYKMFRLLRTSR